ncbi:hypothetical protein BGW36DRAFT_96833 [Talaromyces proteolyticus]|uniref:Secreted protein n=1 Tax=Talaromyces proteolyticus TaxID=1131652 RepID=A0AAD4Q5L8_9EURO|nr:uncharacterized protein BGW36DRAFT_96833 [Talaromyces proteolyticus]KAH8704120.1 hypothetical protein BGW36DRAFT_96833 [Talaromyces proteolyticus]
MQLALCQALDILLLQLITLLKTLLASITCPCDLVNVGICLPKAFDHVSPLCVKLSQPLLDTYIPDIQMLFKHLHALLLLIYLVYSRRAA